ncbi:hypothetical protein [Bradyrhizobium sp. Tv2a-2]|uniref:hypothetical protein n=1 Tax=Bradyrhizobium sp. Tv2a-2 TaxID=113395 RepID=UPI000464BEA6|nr:hypothetical protein [Bradyrhizobium sp. Tv2a-2]
MRFAFALAGLGGFNAHGAGFLAAARACGVEPELVTATSGQIPVLADWFAGKDLRASLISPGQDGNPLAQLQMAFLGYRGVFRPAYPEALQRLVSWPTTQGNFLRMVADRLLPAQEYVPERTEADFKAAADLFNQSKIGVVFNSYDPRAGKGCLYGNAAARKLLPSKKAITNTHAAQVKASDLPHDMRYVSELSDEHELHPITAEAVKSALWLSLYGFQNIPGGQMDGAYYRSCIVSELHVFDHIFVVRPLANGWYAKLPSNWFDVQDWNTEMWFSVGYKAEVDALRRINDLIDAGVINDEKFRKVELIEIEPETPAGYFHYFVERNKVFDRAYEIAERQFERLGLKKPS